ncbi:MAG: hypothetical protein ACE5GQ_08310 [Nitrospinales bacterium]
MIKGIKILLSVLFVFFLSNTAFAKADGSELGLTADAASLQITAWQAGGDEPVNFKRGRGKEGDGRAEDNGVDPGPAEPTVCPPGFDNHRGQCVLDDD